MTLSSKGELEVRIVKTLVALAVCVAVPAQAADWQGTTESRGGFVGARLRLPLGRSVRNGIEPSLTIAPTRTQIAVDGRLDTHIGDGLSLSFGSRKPQLKFGGTPAILAFGFRQQGDVNSKRKAGLSKGAKIGIGAGVAVVTIAAAVFVVKATCVGRDRDFCGSQ